MQFGLSAVATVLIEVLDVPEPPVIMGTTVGYVPENNVFPFCLTSLPLDVTPLAITAGDDDGDDVTFTLLSVDGDVNSTLFVLEALPDNRSVSIWAHATFDYEQTDTFTLVATFTDGTFVEEALFTVKVVDMNDPPVFPADIHCDLPMTAIEGDAVSFVRLVVSFIALLLRSVADDFGDFVFRCDRCAHSACRTKTAPRRVSFRFNTTSTPATWCRTLRTRTPMFRICSQCTRQAIGKPRSHWQPRSGSMQARSQAWW
jgi:hypothetical protein